MMISVVIPIYNGANYLEQCIESLLKQTYKNIEIILINDGSEDQTREICECYSKAYSNIVFLNQQKSGVSRARNNGLDHAKGEYIYFCDSDDILHPQIFEVLVQNLECSKADISTCSYITFEDFPIWPKIKKLSFHTVNDQNTIYTVLTNELCSGYVWNKLFRKDIIEKDILLRFSEKLSIVEDEVFVLQYLCKSRSMCVCEEKLYGYRDNEKGVMKQQFSEKKLSCILGREQALKICKQANCNEEILAILWNKLMQGYAYAYRNLLVHHLKNQNEWKKIVKNKFLLYQKLNYKIDDTWNWRPKLVYYLMKIIWMRKK